MTDVAGYTETKKNCTGDFSPLILMIPDWLKKLMTFIQGVRVFELTVLLAYLRMGSKVGFHKLP